MGFPALSIIALVVAAAFLVWVSEKTGNPAQKVGKFIAWVAIIISVVLLIGQALMCAKKCKMGYCGKEMGKMSREDKGGMMDMHRMMMQQMQQQPPPAEETK